MLRCSTAPKYKKCFNPVRSAECEAIAQQSLERLKSAIRERKKAFKALKAARRQPRPRVCRPRGCHMFARECAESLGPEARLRLEKRLSRVSGDGCTVG